MPREASGACLSSKVSTHATAAAALGRRASSSARPLVAGQVATYAMLWPARRVPGAEVVAVAARDGARAREYAQQHG